MPSHREKVWTVLSMLEWATSYFEKKSVANPRLSIEWLLAEVLEIKRLDLYLKYDRPLTPTELDRLRPMVNRRGKHEPLQYIIGYTDFMDCRIDVSPDVLIPRTETEQLVELILENHAGQPVSDLSLLDIGTGSGCIPAAIKKARPGWSCTGIDYSEKALKLAGKNMQANNVQVELLKMDLLALESASQFRNTRFDLITANPPYIYPSEKQSMDKEVLDFEPPEALFHENPVELYKSIGDFARTHLTSSGMLYLECNDKITQNIVQFLDGHFSTVAIYKDYDNRDRFIKAGHSHPPG
ncbi:MAG: peptide chain release factor N(5)-glutamine methyltransferase [Balneolaceae bacterium]